jgi:hypothetical protein
MTEKANPMKDFINSLPAIDELGIPKATSMEPRLNQFDPSFPKETPKWAVDLSKMRNENPKGFQLYMLEIELKDRIKTGQPAFIATTDEIIRKAEKLDERDWQKNWYRRQIIYEYAVIDAQENIANDRRMEILLKAVLGGDEDLAKQLTPSIINRVKDLQKNS